MQPHWLALDTQQCVCPSTEVSQKKAWRNFMRLKDQKSTQNIVNEVIIVLTNTRVMDKTSTASKAAQAYEAIIQSKELVSKKSKTSNEATFVYVRCCCCSYYRPTTTTCHWTTPLILYSCLYWTHTSTTIFTTTYVASSTTSSLIVTMMSYHHFFLWTLSLFVYNKRGEKVKKLIL